MRASLGNNTGNISDTRPIRFENSGLRCDNTTNLLVSTECKMCANLRKKGQVNIKAS